MEIKTVEIAVSNLMIGMYISDLDIPWSETPYPLQGFHIKSRKDIDRLATFCQHVFIDCDRSEPETWRHIDHAAKSSTTQTGNDEFEITYSVPGQSPAQPRKTFKIPSTSFKKATKYRLKPFSKVVQKADIYIGHAVSMAQELSDNPISVTPEQVDRVANDLTETMIDNPDAALWVYRFKHYHKASYDHGVFATLWALLLGRQLGLAEGQLKLLSAGTLLMGIGKQKIPKHLLDIPAMSYTKNEWHQYIQYIEMSVRILKRRKISDAIIEIVANHRERHSGTGIPKGLTGDKISLLARIAGIADAFQEMIGSVHAERQLSTQNACSHLYSLKDIEFHGELVEKFIQAIGLYPAGTPITLNTGEMGWVMSTNPERKLSPKIWITHDQNGIRLKSPAFLDLQADQENLEPHQIRRTIKSGLKMSAVDLQSAILPRTMKHALNRI